MGRRRPLAAARLIGMTLLKEHLRADLTTALRERDALRAATIRLALTAVTNAEVAGATARELSDDEVVDVLGRELKKRREAAEAFDRAGRPQQAERERAEGVVLEGYLPAPLTDAELRELVASAIGETGASGVRALGQVMKVLTPRTRGRADGGRVSAEVRRQLGS